MANHDNQDNWQGGRQDHERSSHQGGQGYGSGGGQSRMGDQHQGYGRP